MIQAILHYQQIDGRLYKLERELASCDERKEYVKLKKYMENAEEKLDALETKASALKAEAIELSKRYLAAEETLKDFEHLDELVEGGADIAFYKKKAQSIAEQMKKIRSDLTAMTKNIQETSDEYQALKEKVIENQKKYAEAKGKYKVPHFPVAKLIAFFLPKSFGCWQTMPKSSLYGLLFLYA